MLVRAPSLDWVLSISHRLDFAPASRLIEDRLAVGSLLDAFLDEHERSLLSERAAGARIKLGLLPSNTLSAARPAAVPSVLLTMWREQWSADPDARCDLIVRRCGGSGAASDLTLDLAFFRPPTSVTAAAVSPRSNGVLLAKPIALAADRRFFDILTSYVFYQGVLAGVYAERIIAGMRMQLSSNSRHVGVTKTSQLDYLPLTDLECEADFVAAFRQELAECDQAAAPLQFCAFALAATRLLLQLLLLCQEWSAYWPGLLTLRGPDCESRALPTVVEVCAPLDGPRGLEQLLVTLLPAPW